MTAGALLLLFWTSPAAEEPPPEGHFPVATFTAGERDRGQTVTGRTYRHQVTGRTYSH